MRRMLIALTTLLSIALANSACLAAVPVTYIFYGFVTATPQAGPLTPPLYFLVPISVTVDTSYPADTQKDHVTTYSNFLSNLGPKLSPILALVVNGRNAHGEFDQVQITQNAKGIYGICISSSSPGGSSFNVTFTTSVAGVVRGDNLPKQIFPGNFQKATFAYLDPADSYSGSIVE